jgi:hypothetical protein
MREHTEDSADAPPETAGQDAQIGRPMKKREIMEGTQKRDRFGASGLHSASIRRY